jgi:hypothetical protein
MRGLVLGVGAVLLLVFGTTTAAAAPAAVSSVEAPGLRGGPVIVDPGLVWEGANGIALARRSGGTAVLAPPGAPNWNNEQDLAWFGADWWVLAQRSQMVGGSIGGRLRKLAVPQRCNPGSSSISAANTELFAVAGSTLYAALPPVCVGLNARAAWRVYAIDLRTGRRRLLFLAPGSPDSLAAAGGHVAVAYVANPQSSFQERPQTASVAVFGAHSGHLLGRVAPPVGLKAAVSSIQLDDRGDVLMSSGCCTGTGALAEVASATAAQKLPTRPSNWWAPPGARVGREIELGRGAVLSHGRVAALSRSGEGLELTDLRGGRRQLVAFSGVLEVSGMALAGNELAWGEQFWSVLPTAPHECRSVELARPLLSAVDLRSPRTTPISIAGPPRPPNACPEKVPPRAAG